MNIQIDDRISKKYFSGYKRKSKPTEIVIHSTAGGGDVIKWMVDGGYMGMDKNGVKKYRVDDYKKGIGLFHFINDRNGKVTQIIDPDKWVYHSSSGSHDATTIGIENIKQSRDNSDDLTSDQYSSLYDLIQYLVGIYTIDTITTHDYNAKTYSGRPPKPCPGPMFWEDIEKFAYENKIKVLR